MHEREDNLRRYEPVPDELVLAAVDRAERHRGHEREGVLWADIVAHLGFVKSGWTTQQLRPQRDALIAAELMAVGRRQGLDVWSLTDAGRAQLEAARRAGRMGELPEAPQHRVWRDARAHAAELVEPLRASARAGAEEALALLDDRQRSRSDAWLLLAERLGKVYRQLGLATHCVYEWPEPDDGRADIDDYEDPGDEQLDADGRGHLRYLRRYRRSQGNLRLDEPAQQEASARQLITVRRRWSVSCAPGCTPRSATLRRVRAGHRRSGARGSPRVVRRAPRALRAYVGAARSHRLEHAQTGGGDASRPASARAGDDRGA